MEQKDSSHNQINISYIESDEVKSSSKYEDSTRARNDAERYISMSDNADTTAKKSITSIDINKCSNKNNKNSLFLEAEVGAHKNCEILEPTENRIFGRATDRLSNLNTEAVKFSFGSCTTETSQEETLVDSEKDVHKNQNEVEFFKQNMLNLGKQEDSRKSAVNNLKGSSGRVQSQENITTRIEYHSEIKEIYNPETAVNETAVTKTNIKESSSADSNLQNAETICKTCLAIQAAEKLKQENTASNLVGKADNLLLGTFTDYGGKESERSANSQNYDGNTLYETHKTNQFSDNDPMREELSGEDQTLTIKQCEKIIETNQNHMTSSLDRKTEAEICRAPFTTEYQDRQPLMTNAFAKQHDSLAQRASSSSENSELLEDESLDSIGQAPEQEVAAKKHRHGWISKLFSRLRRRKIEKSG